MLRVVLIRKHRNTPLWAGVLTKASIAALLIALTLMTQTGATSAAVPTGIAIEAAGTYTVQDGDTLLAIAAKLGIPTDQQPAWITSVVALNGLTSPDQLSLGQMLSLPGAGGSSTPESATKPVAGGSYTVQDGDTLLGIAGKQNVPTDGLTDWVAAVVTLNSLIDSDHLTLGQTLTLPATATSTTTTVTAAAAPSPPPPAVLPIPLAPPPTAPFDTRPVVAPTTRSLATTFLGSATPYSDSLAGNSLGCMGAGKYDPNDVTVIAMGPAQYAEYPCGTVLEVCGTAGCITGIRKDSCPGCGSYHVDLSRAGFKVVCGIANNCQVRIRVP